MTWTAALGSPGARPLFASQEAWCAATWAARRTAGPWGPRGAVGLLGCGHGKTLCVWLTPALLGAARPLILLPAATRAQVRAEVASYATDYPALRGVLDRAAVVTYEALSNPAAASHRGGGLLERLRPDLVVADEAHKLGNPEGVGWRRLTRYLLDHPGTRYAPLSGTLSWSSVRQLAHHLHAALRDASPIPAWVVDALATVVDVGGEPSSVDWATVGEWLGERVATKQRARELLFERILATPGVVHRSGVAADVSLTIRALPRPDGFPGTIDTALGRLAERWELPDGAELVDAIEVYAAERTLSWGHWRRWRDDARRDPAWAPWFAARATWAGVVARARHSGLESPGVVSDLARAGRLPLGDLGAWSAWEAVRRAGPERETVWLDDATRAWVTGHLAELRAHGLVWYCGRGVEGALASSGPVHGAGSARPTLAGAGASWRVHGTGWNGQGYPRCAIAEAPTSAADWEQLLARSHRPGQTRDVEVVVVAYTAPQRDALRASVAAARYAATALGQPQRLLLATWPQGRPA